MKCHRSIKYLLISLLLLSFLVLFFKSKIHAESHEEKNVNFRWAFVAIVETDHDQQLVSITRSTVLKTGDRIKMFVEPQKCFVYFIHRSEADEIELLFPYSLEQFDNERETTRKHFIPRGDEWFEMDGNTGLETFYLIASSSRLSKMEELLAKHARTEGADREEIAKEILEVIHNLKKKYRSIIASAERPMSIGGSIRGITKNEQAGLINIDLTANQISANNFYSRTFTIDHR
jgi:hypothetical protein